MARRTRTLQHVAGVIGGLAPAAERKRRQRPLSALPEPQLTDFFPRPASVPRSFSTIVRSNFGRRAVVAALGPSGNKIMVIAAHERAPLHLGGHVRIDLEI